MYLTDYSFCARRLYVHRVLLAVSAARGSGTPARASFRFGHVVIFETTDNNVQTLSGINHGHLAHSLNIWANPSPWVLRSNVSRDRDGALTLRHGSLQRHTIKVAVLTVISILDQPLESPVYL